MADYDDIEVTRTGHVALIEIQRPPHNFFDIALIRQLADACNVLDADNNCRSIVLAAQGKSFCAGANFGDGSGQKIITALVPDFRVTCPEGRFSANFTRLGFHPGFGLTHTLPALVGQQNAALMMYTGRRVKGQEAFEMGLADKIVPLEKIRDAAMELAEEIAISSPLGVLETRATLRSGLAERVRVATDHELKIQNELRQTEDFKEGVAATAERRIPNFQGR